MKYLIYVSSATENFTEEDLKKLLILSRENNHKAGITGLLLFSDNNFIQVIEGEPSAIDALYAKITSDPRHRGFLKLHQGAIQQRNFPEWTMGFKQISREDFSSVSGFENVEGLQSASMATLKQTTVLSLLKNFLKINAGNKY